MHQARYFRGHLARRIGSTPVRVFSPVYSPFFAIVRVEPLSPRQDRPLGRCFVCAFQPRSRNVEDEGALPDLPRSLERVVEDVIKEVDVVANVGVRTLALAKGCYETSFCGHELCHGKAFVRNLLWRWFESVRSAQFAVFGDYKGFVRNKVACACGVGAALWGEIPKGDMFFLQKMFNNSPARSGNVVAGDGSREIYLRGWRVFLPQLLFFCLEMFRCDSPSILITLIVRLHLLVPKSTASVMVDLPGFGEPRDDRLSWLVSGHAGDVPLVLWEIVVWSCFQVWIES